VTGSTAVSRMMYRVPHTTGDTCAHPTHEVRTT
jgi:hypothetical protein